MHIGALIFPTDLSIRPAQLARELEDRGFESLWVTEHTHIPTSRRTPWPGGAELPEEYRRTLDPYVALAAAATVTERLRLGTGISLVAQHDPIVLAKTIGYASGTSTHVLSLAELTHAINGLAPAEACTTMDHPNLRAWRDIVAEVESNPYRGIVAVFIGDLDDPVSSEADGSLRTQLPD